MICVISIFFSSYTLELTLIYVLELTVAMPFSMHLGLRALTDFFLPPFLCTVSLCVMDIFRISTTPPPVHHCSICSLFLSFCFHSSLLDEGMTNGPSTFAYLVFGSGGIPSKKSQSP
jgi:hypothetical protein